RTLNSVPPLPVRSGNAEVAFEWATSTDLNPNCVILLKVNERKVRKWEGVQICYERQLLVDLNFSTVAVSKVADVVQRPSSGHTIKELNKSILAFIANDIVDFGESFERCAMISGSGYSTDKRNDVWLLLLQAAA